MRVTVLADVCQGHTLCHMTAPDVFQLRNEDGHAYVAVDQLTPELLAAAKRAALTCPEQAIVVQD